MRADMQKVIVERPRHGGRGLIYTPRRRGEEWENFPRREGIRRQWKDLKELSDNLNRLWRYLDKHVRARPWDSEWSEICQALDFRGVLGFHVKTHIDVSGGLVGCRRALRQSRQWAAVPTAPPALAAPRQSIRGRL